MADYIRLYRIAKTLLFSCLSSSKWHQCHEPCQFDGVSEHALVATAKFSVFVRLDLKLSRHKLAQYIRLFIVNVIYFVLTRNARHRHKMTND